MLRKKREITDALQILIFILTAVLQLIEKECADEHGKENGNV